MYDKYRIIASRQNQETSALGTDIGTRGLDSVTMAWTA